MKNIAFINSVSMNDISLRPIVDGRSSLERAVAFARTLTDVSEVAILLSRPVAGMTDVRAETRDSWSTDDILSALKKHSDGFDDIFYFFGDCPLLDPTVAARMYGNHRKYYADYTFADGFPYGIAPEILRRDVVERLEGLAARRSLGKGRPGRGTLFDLIKLDINSFDIETELAPKDQRLLRVSLTSDTERNFLIVKRVVELGGEDAASTCRILEMHPEIQRSLPAFFPVQIVERCPQTCSYCPYPRFGGDILANNGAMSAADFSRIVDSISRFCDDAVIDISLWGEPGLHPGIVDIMRIALEKPRIRLVVETSGIGWDQGAFREIAGLPRHPTWILSLDASDEGVYRALRGEGFAESRRTAKLLSELFPEELYVQAVRMKENEEDLETFYKAWKEKTERLIIQKYDSFCGFLPERKVTDLSPLKRFPCWHVMRDLPILMDGTVTLCREDVGREHVLGNALKEDLAAIWRRGEEFHRAHISRDYPRICASCDEWYTYTF